MSAPTIHTLPVYLFPGQVAIYGPGSITGISGIVPKDSNFLFGYVYQTGGDVVSQLGDSVMFRSTDAICRIAVSGWPYIIFEGAKLALIEAPPTIS